MIPTEERIKMDTKFRKLISRLSIKEKKLEKNPYPRMLSISALPCGGEEDQSKVRDEIFLESWETNPPELRTLTTATNPHSNILTNVQFSCPTLLRKSKSMSEKMCEDERENVGKVNSREAEDAPGEDGEKRTLPARATSDSTDENNNVIVGHMENGDGGDRREQAYMNLQELEQERRRLIAAQRVRAKYAENWIDGQIEDESILGNKEKTKIYWESRLRNGGDSHEDKDKFNGLNKTRDRSLNTSPIIQKINAEIEELHRREKELKSGTCKEVLPLGSGSGSLNGDEEDVFSSNGSSVDEFEHSESPRLESGFYSNLGEDESQEAQFLSSSDVIKVTKGVDPDSEVKVTTHTHAPLTSPPSIEKEGPLTVSLTQPSALETLKVSEEGLVQSLVKVRSEVNARTFIFQNETPIEKEIRVSVERDEEHRLQRLSSSSGFQSIPATPKTPTKGDKNSTVGTPLTVTVTSQVEEKRFSAFVSTKESKRNVQYQLATDRLRREMLEAKEREDELRTVHRAMSISTLNDDDETEVGRQDLLLMTTTVPPPPPPIISTPKHVESTSEIQVRSIYTPEQVKYPFNEIQRRTSSTSSETPSIPSPTFRSSAFGKSGINSFNSFQRYLLRGSSAQLRIVNNFQVPPPVKIEDVKAEEPIQVKVNEGEDLEPETPRRKLIPATHKIQNELREMKAREKELALVRTRTFKSTPNLAVMSEDANEDEVKVKVKEVTSSAFAAKERKRSNLINQWEEIIQNGN